MNTLVIESTELWKYTILLQRRVLSVDFSTEDTIILQDRTLSTDVLYLFVIVIVTQLGRVV